MALTMDLTGAHPDYREDYRVWRIFKYGQKVDFEATVFADSIQVYLLSSGNSKVALRLQQDYIVPQEMIDTCDNEMSAAKLMDPTFESTLCSGIQMIRGVAANELYTVAVSYQRLYPNTLRMSYYHNERFSVTPELIRMLVERYDEFTEFMHRSLGITTEESDGALVLEEDPSKTNLNNYIEDEEHQLNVPGGVFLIHPKGGCFYSDSVTVTTTGGTELVEGVDYRLVGMDEARTKVTSYTKPLYEFILVSAPVVDKVKVSYHAFGGEPTIDNYRYLLHDVAAMESFLKDSTTLTIHNLNKTEIMTSLMDRVVRLEDNVRRLQGTPAYGDITSGKAILMKLFADTPGMHWYTIASMYQANGTDMAPSTADTFIFRLQSQLSHFQFQAAVSVDLSNTENEKFSVNVISDNYPRGFIPCEDYSNIASIIRPQLRVIWNDASSHVSGCLLQLGFNLVNMLEETICIEDMSGHESCWKLVDEIAAATLPSDDDVALPDGESTWSTILESSKESSSLIPFKKGHLAWAGDKPMNNEDGWQYFEIDPDNGLLLEEPTNIAKFTKLRLDVQEHEGHSYPVDIPLAGSLTHLKGHATFTHQEKPVYVNADVYRDGDHNAFRLNWDVTAGVDANRITLKDIVVFL